MAESWDRKLNHLHHFEVVDTIGMPVGLVEGIWLDGREGFLGVQASWLLTTARVIPTCGMVVDATMRVIRVAFPAEQIRMAPRCPVHAQLSADSRRRLEEHYCFDDPPWHKDSLAHCREVPGEEASVADTDRRMAT